MNKSSKTELECKNRIEILKSTTRGISPRDLEMPTLKVLAGRVRRSFANTYQGFRRDKIYSSKVRLFKK